MAIVDAGGLGGALVNRPDGELQPNRPEAGRVSGGGRAAGETGARGGGDAVVVDLSPTARAIVETGTQAVREADTAPGTNDAPTRAAAREPAGSPSDALVSPAAATRRAEEAGEVTAGAGAADAEEAAEGDAATPGNAAGSDRTARSARPSADGRDFGIGRRLSVTV